MSIHGSSSPSGFHPRDRATSYKTPTTSSEWGGFTARDYKAGGATLSLLSTYMQTGTDKDAAAFDRFTGEQKARLLIRNADQRFAAGTREAQAIAHGGRKTESDAIAAMIAQGGTVDPLIIAKLNQHTTYNALSAIFEGTRDSNAMVMEAQNVRSTARINEMVAKTNAANTNFGATMQFGMSIMNLYVP
jgi:hypothetical protein